MNANISNEVRRGIYRRDGFRCALCDSTDGLQIHHVVPRGVGGSNSPMNLICLCWRCHNAAHGSMCCNVPPDISPSVWRPARRSGAGSSVLYCRRWGKGQPPGGRWLRRYRLGQV